MTIICNNYIIIIVGILTTDNVVIVVLWLIDIAILYSYNSYN